MIGIGKSRYLLVPGLRDSDGLVPGFPGPFGTEKLLNESIEDSFTRIRACSNASKSVSYVSKTCPVEATNALCGQVRSDLGYILK